MSKIKSQVSFSLEIILFSWINKEKPKKQMLVQISGKALIFPERKSDLQFFNWPVNWTQKKDAVKD